MLPLFLEWRRPAFLAEGWTPNDQEKDGCEKGVLNQYHRLIISRTISRDILLSDTLLRLRLPVFVAVRLATIVKPGSRGLHEEMGVNETQQSITVSWCEDVYIICIGEDIQYRDASRLTFSFMHYIHLNIPHASDGWERRHAFSLKCCV